jgi:hypothetical protein
VITFIPFPTAPTIGVTTQCAGGTTPFKSWQYTIRIQNPSNVPFNLLSWTTNASAFTQTNTAADFGLRFGTTTIAAGATVQANYCVWFISASSGTVFHTFLGNGGNGPYTSPTLTLAP